MFSSHGRCRTARILTQPLRPVRAFTLIELLVVVAIISLLLAILLPALNKARDQAKTVRGLSNLRQQAVGIQMYAMAYNDYFPLGEGGSPASDWGTRIGGFITGGSMVFDNTNAKSINPVFLDPSADIQKGKVHYACHPRLMPQAGWIANYDANPNQYWAMPATRTTTIPRPFELVMTFDSGQTDNGNCWSINLYLDDFWTNWSIPIRKWLNYKSATANDPIPYADESAGHIRYRQLGGTAANFNFVDGHAATIRRGQVLQKNVRY